MQLPAPMQILAEKLRYPSRSIAYWYVVMFVKSIRLTKLHIINDFF